MPPKRKSTSLKSTIADFKTLFEDDVIPPFDEASNIISAVSFNSKPGLLKEALAHFVFSHSSSSQQPVVLKVPFLLPRSSEVQRRIQKQREEEFECLTGIPAELYKYNWLLTDDEWFFRRFAAAATSFADMKLVSVDTSEGFVLFSSSGVISLPIPEVDIFPGGLSKPFFGEELEFEATPIEEDAGGDSDEEDRPEALTKPPRTSPQRTSPLRSSPSAKTFSPSAAASTRRTRFEKYERDRALDAPPISQAALAKLRVVSRRKKAETDKLKKAFSIHLLMVTTSSSRKNTFKYNQNALSYSVVERRKFILSRIRKETPNRPLSLDISFDSLKKIRDTSIFSDIPREVSGIISASSTSTSSSTLEAHSECLFFGSSDTADPSLYYFDFHTHPLRTAIESANSSTAFPSGDDVYSSFSNYEKGSIASIVIAPEGVYAHWLTPEAQAALVSLGISERAPSSEGLAFGRLIEGAILGVSSDAMRSDESDEGFKILFNKANLDAQGGNIYAEAVSEQFGLSICENKERKECIERSGGVGSSSEASSKGFIWCAYKYSEGQIQAAKEWAARLGVSFTVRRLLEFVFDKRETKKVEWFVNSFGQRNPSRNPDSPLFGAAFQSWDEIEKRGAFTGLPRDLLEKWIPPYDRFMQIDLSTLASFSSSSSSTSTLMIPKDYRKFGNSEDEDDPFAVPFFNKRMVSTKWPTACVWLGAYRRFNPNAFVSPVNPYDFYTFKDELENEEDLVENEKQIRDLDRIRDSVFKFFEKAQREKNEQTQIDINTLRKTGKCPSKPYKISKKDAKILLASR